MSRVPARLARPLLLALAYGGLILGFTWPLPLVLSDHLVLSRGSDLWPHIWNFAWVRTALLDLHQSPYYTYSIFYPGGVPLVYHALNIFSAIVSLPLQLVFGLIPAFNLLLLGNLVAAGLATYWLARVLGLDVTPAFVAGLLFACCPPLGAAFNQGQAELVSVFWMPLYIGLLLRGGGFRALGLPPGHPAYLVAAGLALAGSALAIWYWFVSLLVFTAVYSALELWATARASGRGPATRWLGRPLLVGGLALLALSPLLAVLVREQLGSGANLDITPTPTINAVIFFGSEDLLAFFLPLPGHADSNAPDALHGANLGFGWTVLALAGAAVALCRGPRRRSLRLWALVGLALAVLALGPALIVANRATGLPLPYAAILHLPGAAAMRVPLRFATLLALCVALLAAQGLAAGQARLRTPRGRAGLSALAGLLAIVEFFGLPRPLIQPENAAFFRQLATQPAPCRAAVAAPPSGCGAVLELPYATWGAPAMFHQAIDQHPMVGGYISRHYPYDFASDTPGIAQLTQADPTAFRPDIISPTLAATALEAMDYYGVRYVVVHPLGDDPQAGTLPQVLRAVFGGPGVPSDELTVYTVPATAQRQPIPILEDGWYDPEHDSTGTRWRWTRGSATLRVVVPPAAAGAYTLTLDTYAVAVPRTLRVSLDGQEIAAGAVALPPGGPRQVALTLAPGEHRLTLAAPEPPVQVGNDPRLLSLAFRAIVFMRR